MKRRTFLKTVGGAAGAAALTGCKTQGADSSNSTSPTNASRKALSAARGSFKKNHKQQKTYGVAEKSDDEFTDVFSLSRRMPGWFPDAADPRDDEDYLFPEEVIRHA